MLRSTLFAVAAAALLAGCSLAPRRPTAVVAISAPQIQALVARPGARATLVNVWATWCGPCREEFPTLVQVGKKRRAEGLRLVFVSADPEEEIGAVRTFLATRGVTDTAYIIHGDSNQFIDTLNPKWTGAIPATFVYDARGRLSSFWEGAANEAEFDESVNQALATRVSQGNVQP